MNGVALALTLATLGVDYSFRTTEEGQIEYTIQIEPEFLKSLAEGEEIHSDVPPEAGNVQRICVRIGTTPVRHTAASIQQFKRLSGRHAATCFIRSRAGQRRGPADDRLAGRSNPEESFGVDYGWQPDQNGQLAYYVQIDPTTLKTLAAGDEIHAAIDPAAGRVGSFVVTSGNKPLPRVRPAASRSGDSHAETGTKQHVRAFKRATMQRARPPTDSFRHGRLRPARCHFAGVRRRISGKHILPQDELVIRAMPAFNPRHQPLRLRPAAIPAEARCWKCRGPNTTSQRPAAAGELYPAE